MVWYPQTRTHRNGGCMEERTKLIRARQQKHWTQEQAAGKAGVDTGTYGKWERGIVTPRASSIQLLCDAFEMSASALGLDSEEVSIPSVSYNALISNNLALRLQALGLQPQSYQTVQVQITVILKEHDTMNKGNNDYQITRRQALLCLAGLPFIASLRETTANVARNPGEVITQCAASIASCWILSKSSYDEDLRQAFDTASAFLPVLKDIAQDLSHYHRDAATLIAQCSLLKTVMGWHLEGLKEAALYAQEAVTYAKKAGDANLQATALDFLAWIYYYGRRTKQAEEANAQALLLLNGTPPLSPLLCSRIYGTRALILAKNGKDGSIGMLDRANYHFFATSEDTAEFVYLDYDKASLLQSDGMAHYHQGALDEAMASFKQIVEEKSLTPKVSLSERTRVETLNLMALSTLKRRNKDKQETLHYWEAAISGARALQSEQFFNDAVGTYEIMSVLWPDDNHIKKELSQFTMHW